MALRFLVLVGRRQAPVEALALGIAQRASLVLGFSHEHVAILASDADAVLPLPGAQGAIVGTLFQKEALAPRIRRFDEARNPGRSHDPVRVLHADYWGAYLSVTLDDVAVTVCRDPSGLLSCLYLATPDVIAFASDAALLEEAGIYSPAIAWSALGRLLYANELPQQRMALSGLLDLHAGTCARMTEGQIAISTTWSPWSFTAPEHGASLEHLAAKVAQTVDRCIGSWAQERCRTVVAISGGLDSSVVATSLLQGGDGTLSALTISTRDTRGDESFYAKALSDHLGLDLSYGHYEQASADLLKSASAHLPRPAGRAPTQAYDAVVRHEMNRLGADAFFTGSGGDNVFYSTQSARPLVDRYLAHGLHRGLASTARDISRLTGASLWSVLRFAARVPRGPGAKFRWPADMRFLSEAQCDANQTIPLSHPWLDAPNDALPGKTSHVAMILRAQHYLDNYDRRLPFTAVHPLLSQPIVEAMLSVPTWLAIADGQDRAVARHAFSSRFPPVVANRRIKGGPDGFASQILRANLQHTREILLDGALCAQGLLDQEALVAALTEPAMARGHDYVRLLLLLDVEGWIACWRR